MTGPRDKDELRRGLCGRYVDEELRPQEAGTCPECDETGCWAWFPHSKGHDSHKCWRCDIGGDVLDFIGRVKCLTERADFPAVCEAAAALLDAQPEGWQPANRLSYAEAERVLPADGWDHQGSGRWRREHPDHAFAAYVAASEGGKAPKRRWEYRYSAPPPPSPPPTEEWWATVRARLAAGPPDALELAAKKGWTLDGLVTAGVGWVDTQDAPAGLGGRFAFPEWVAAEESVRCVLYRPGGTPKTWACGPRGLFCPPEVQPGAVVVLTEGAGAAVTCICADLPAFGKYNVSALSEADGRRIAAAAPEMVLVLPDCEPRARENARLDADLLRRLGMRAVIVDPAPERGLGVKGNDSTWGHDVGDLLVESRDARVANGAEPGEALSCALAALREYVLANGEVTVPEQEPSRPAQAEGADEPPTRESQASRILAVVSEVVELFRTPGGETWASFDSGRKRETCPANSRPVRLFITKVGAQAYGGKPPSATAVKAVADLLGANATFGDDVREVHTRVAMHEGDVYIDLADEQGRAVRVTGAGWGVVTNPPVHFRRDTGQLPLPVPAERGSWDPLDDLLLLPDDTQRMLARGWLTGSEWPFGPYAVLNLPGQQGATKSSITRNIRQLIDPSAVPLRKTPKEVRDLFVSAKRSRVLAFDNLSHLEEWLSDAFCTIATGGGYATRTLYENDEETLFQATNPIIINGIANVVIRGDLLDRSITLELLAFEGRRLTEAVLRRRLELAHPLVLAAIIEALSCAIRRRDEVEAALDDLPRMADFALTVEAAAPALGWEQGAFIAAYEANRAVALEAQLEASPVAEALLGLLAGNAGEWEGTAADLLAALAMFGRLGITSARGWPQSAKGMGDALSRLAPALKGQGVSIDRRRSHGRTLLTIRQGDREPS